MLVNCSNESPKGISPSPKKGRKRPKTRTRGNSSSSESQEECFPSPLEAHLPEDSFPAAHSSPVKAATTAAAKKKSSKKRNKKHEQDQASETEQEYQRSSSKSKRKEEFQAHLEKLRELLPSSGSSEGMSQDQVIESAVSHINRLRETLENHPGLRGLDPHVLAAPGNPLSPVERLHILLQQRNYQQQRQLLRQQQSTQRQQSYEQQQQQSLATQGNCLQLPDDAQNFDQNRKVSRRHTCSQVELQNSASHTASELEKRYPSRKKGIQSGPRDLPTDKKGPQSGLRDLTADKKGSQSAPRDLPAEPRRSRSQGAREAALRRSLRASQSAPEEGSSPQLGARLTRQARKEKMARLRCCLDPCTASAPPAV